MQTAIASASAASSGRGSSAHPEDELDHPLDLLLVGGAVARDRALDLVRRRLADRPAVLGRREQHDAPRLPDGHRRLGVPAEEEPLDGDDGRLVEREQVVEERVDREQPLRHRQVRARLETAVVDRAKLPAVPFDDAVAECRCPRVDPEDDHPATSANTSSGMSKLAVTRWTSSRSSSSSTSRSAWRAFVGVELDRLLRDHRVLGRVDRDAGRVERQPDALQVGRRRVDLDRLGVLGVDVLGAGVDRGQGDLVGIDPVARDGDQAARLELPGDGARTGQLAAGLGEDRADLGRRPVAVVGRGLDEDGHAAGAVALVDDLLELLGLAAAGRLVDRPLDVVGRHVDRAGLLDREPEPVVGVRVAAALPRGDADLAGDLREERAAFGVRRRPSGA